MNIIKIILCIITLLPISVYAENYEEQLPKTGKGISDFAAGKFKIIGSAESDLNADGIKDFAAVLEAGAPQKSQSPQVTQQAQSYDNQQPEESRLLLIAFGDGNGAYKKVIENSGAIPLSYDSGRGGMDLFRGFEGGLTIEKNSLFISLEDIHISWKYQFKYMKDNFYLIGYSSSSINTSTNNTTDYSYNYLTNKKKETVSVETDKGMKILKTKWYKIPKKALVSLDKYDRNKWEMSQ